MPSDRDAVAIVVISVANEGDLSQELKAELGGPASGHELDVNGKGLDMNGKRKAGTGADAGISHHPGWLGCVGS